MIPRGVLDVDLATLLWAALARSSPFARAPVQPRDVERLWNTQRSALVSLSVRSGFDALLTALDWPAGSEVLVSCVTIPDMVKLLEAHGLTPAPIDVDPDTLGPDPNQIALRVTSRTKAILVAHLFGSRLNLEPIAEVARRHGLMLWEDGAQCYAADGHPGAECADVSLFSFGTIKTQTAFGGALLRFRDPALAAAVRAVQETWPMQTAGEFQRKVRRGLLLRTLGMRPAFTVAASLAQAFGVDLDERLVGAVRGFRPDDFPQQLRRRPSPALLALLQARLARPNRAWLQRRTQQAIEYLSHLPAECVVGGAVSFPTHWVLPVQVGDPARGRAELWRRGYDATSRASQLRVVSPRPEHSEWTTPLAAEWMPRLLYLPLHPALRSRHIQEIAEVVADLATDPRRAASLAT